MRGAAGSAVGVVWVAEELNSLFFGWMVDATLARIPSEHFSSNLKRALRLIKHPGFFGHPRRHILEGWVDCGHALQHPWYTRYTCVAMPDT
jgi:hypothetical protein